MTLGSLMLAYHHRRKWQEERDLENWKRTRYEAFIMVRLWADPKSAPSTPEALLQLKGEERVEDDVMNASPEEQKQFFEDLRKQGWKV
jgi:hypothetical protein